ncbi:MAG: 2-amino-4-hydroxy-6-hydroxymethyldihydropteridine diphosphokinase [Myxococcales bacterium]|nr:2-amino-4-hydroxy-6-hydroxymethyldihydropteridine diphosphokinase [Myxococcales bacterium]
MPARMVAGPAPPLDAVVGLGSNLGSRCATIDAAIAAIDADPRCVVRARSRMYDSAAVGPVQPRYRNAAVRVSTDLGAHALLDLLLDVERRLGRVRQEGLRWGPRTIDLDLLWCAAPPPPSPHLTVPHPGLESRAFALAPLLDVAPELAARYGDALDRTQGSAPARAVTAPSATVGRRDAEPFALIVSPIGDVPASASAWSDRADRLASVAAALPALLGAPAGPPRAYVHLRFAATESGWSGALTGLLRRGFVPSAASIGPVDAPPGSQSGAMVGPRTAGATLLGAYGPGWQTARVGTTASPR